MANELGVSFAPTFAGAEAAKQNRYAAQPQGAVKTLNFRLPQVTGSATSRALSPLVTDEQRGSTFGGAVLQSVLRTILGSDAAASMMGYGAQEPQGSPVLQTRDLGSDFFNALRTTPAPQPGPADNVNMPQFDGVGDALGPPTNPVAVREGTDPSQDPSLAPRGRNQTLHSKYHDDDPMTAYLWNQAAMDPFGGFGNYRDAPVSLGAPPRPGVQYTDTDLFGGGGRA